MQKKSTSPLFHFPCFFRIMMLSVLRHTKTPVKFWFLKNYLSPSFKVSLSPRLFTNTLVSPRWSLAVITAVFKSSVRWLGPADLALCSRRRGFVCIAWENRIFRPVLSSVYLSECRNRLTDSCIWMLLSIQSPLRGPMRGKQSGTCQQLLVTTFLLTVATAQARL